MTLRKDYLFNHSNCSHPSLEVVLYLFLSLKGRQSSILWSVLCRFHWLYHCCHSLSLIAICCHSLLLVLLVLTLYHLLHHSLSLVVIRCCSSYHSLSFVVTRFTTRCHSLSLVVPLVVIRCHSLSLDVPLVCLFINDPGKIQINLYKFTNYIVNYIVNIMW